MNDIALKGKFLVIDGPDGAGKSTQAKMLADFLRQQGVDVLACRDPGGTRIGDKIRHILLDNDHGEMAVRCEALLYMASRAQLYDEVIDPALQAGKCVISDRWVSSTYAYQAVAGKLGPDLVLKIAEASLARTWPDLTIILDLPAEQGLGRLSNRSLDRMEEKGQAYHQRVREAFLDLAKGRRDFVVINADGDLETVQRKLRQAVADHDYR